MPIYEYEPKDDRECLICSGRVGVLQSIDEPSLEYCPTCGLEVIRVIGQVQIKIDKSVDFDKAATRGFTTYRKAQSGTWEKIAGEGDSLIQRDNSE